MSFCSRSLPRCQEGLLYRLVLLVVVLDLVGEVLVGGPFVEAKLVVKPKVVAYHANGWELKDALEYLKSQPSYVYKKAYADALRKKEDERQEEIRRFVPPFLIPIKERIAAARAKAALTGWCNLFAACPTW
jgi:hypothetical protein